MAGTTPIPMPTMPRLLCVGCGTWLRLEYDLVSYLGSFPRANEPVASWVRGYELWIMSWVACPCWPTVYACRVGYTAYKLATMLCVYGWLCDKSFAVEVRVQWEWSADGVEVVDPCKLPCKCDDVATKLIVQVTCGYSSYEGLGLCKCICIQRRREKVVKEKACSMQLALVTWKSIAQNSCCALLMCCFDMVLVHFSFACIMYCTSLVSQSHAIIRTTVAIVMASTVKLVLVTCAVMAYFVRQFSGIYIYRHTLALWHAQGVGHY